MILWPHLGQRIVGPHHSLHVLFILYFIQYDENYSYSKNCRHAFNLSAFQAHGPTTIPRAFLLKLHQAVAISTQECESKCLSLSQVSSSRFRLALANARTFQSDKCKDRIGEKRTWPSFEGGKCTTLYHLA